MIVNLLLKTNGKEADGLILFLVVWSALIVSWWVVVACGRSYLGPAKISSFVFLV